MFGYYLQNENVALGSNKVGGRSLVIGGPSILLPDTPINLMQSGNYPRNISMIAGVTKNEGTFLTASKPKLFQQLKLSEN